MENKDSPTGRFRIIIADVEEERILLNEEVICICGAFAKLNDASSGRCSTHGMVLSSYYTDIAFKTAEGAKDAVRKMEKGAREVNRRSFFKMIKKLFRKKEE